MKSFLSILALISLSTASFFTIHATQALLQKIEKSQFETFDQIDQFIIILVDFYKADQSKRTSKNDSLRQLFAAKLDTLSSELEDSELLNKFLAELGATRENFQDKIISRLSTRIDSNDIFKFIQIRCLTNAMHKLLPNYFATNGGKLTAFFDKQTKHLRGEELGLFFKRWIGFMKMFYSTELENIDYENRDRMRRKLVEKAYNSYRHVDASPTNERSPDSRATSVDSLKTRTGSRGVDETQEVVDKLEDNATEPTFESESTLESDTEEEQGARPNIESQSTSNSESEEEKMVVQGTELNAIDGESHDSDERGKKTPRPDSCKTAPDLNRTRPPLITDEPALTEDDLLRSTEHDTHALEETNSDEESEPTSNSEEESLEQKEGEKTLEEFMSNADQAELLEFIKKNGALLAELLKSLPPEQKKKSKQPAVQVLAELQKDQKAWSELLQLMLETEGISSELKELFSKEKVTSEESEYEEEQQEEAEFSSLEIDSEGLSNHEKSVVSAPWKLKHVAAIITTFLVATIGGIATEHYFEITKKIRDLFKGKTDNDDSPENKLYAGY